MASLEQLGEAMLQLDSVTRRFGERIVVADVTIGVPTGQMVGIIGRSGAGKSTLLRMVNRLIEPTAGRLLFDGRDITRLKGRALHSWRANAAMIFQQVTLVPRLHGARARIGDPRAGSAGYRRTGTQPRRCALGGTAAARRDRTGADAGAAHPACRRTDRFA